MKEKKARFVKNHFRRYQGREGKGEEGRGKGGGGISCKRGGGGRCITHDGCWPAANLQRYGIYQLEIFPHV